MSENVRPVPRPNGKSGASGASQEPTADEPLRGLPKLAAVAIVGRANILALAAKLVVYVWQDIATLGIVVGIAGPPGSGKTTLLFLVLAARMNTGSPVNVLGRKMTPAPEGKFVVLIEAEHGERSASRKLARSCRLLGVDDGALARVILVARRGVRIGSPEWAEVGRMVAAGLVSDIALDTLARVAPADGNDEREQIAIFDQIVRTIELAPSEEAKPVAWVAMHTRKADGEIQLADISGSVQRSGQADSVLIVTAQKVDGRVTSSRVTFAKLREEPDLYPGPVDYTVTQDRIVEINAASAEGRPLEEQIFERLALGPQTKNSLKRKLNRNGRDIEHAITTLFQARRIQTVTVKVRGKDCKAFAVRTVGTPGPVYQENDP